MSTILVLAGGLDQVKLIQSLKSRGYCVVLVDFNVNPIAKPYCDFHEQVSTLDVEEVEKCAKKYQVSSIITACTDQALLTAAEVSEKLSLFFPHSANETKLLTNKKWMKEHFHKNGLLSSSYQVAKHFSELNIKTNDFPLVIKPVDSNSSKGVFKVNNHKELENRFLQVKKYSRDKQVIVESFNEGVEISIDGFVDSNGFAHLLLISRSFKNGTGDNGFPISGSLYCPDFFNSHSIQISDLLQRVAKTFKLTNTPLLVQAILTDKNVSIIELSARCGGGMKHRLIEAVSGFNIIDATIDSILGKPAKVKDIILSNQCWMMKYLYAELGKIKIANYDPAIKDAEVWLTKFAGTVISGNSTSSDRVGSILLSGDDFSQLSYKLKDLYDQINIIDYEGNDILMRSDLKALN